MKPYNFKNYKEYLKSYLEKNKSKGIVSQVAAACGCDRTYLSQVFSGKAELTPDHIIQFCESYSLSDSESQYLLLLLLRDRSASAIAKRRLQKQLDDLKQKSQALSHQVSEKEALHKISETQRTLYYSSWLYGAVHTLTSIPSLQTASAIAEKLNIATPAASRILKELVEMNVVEKNGDKFVHSGHDIYLPSECPQSYSNHFSWRMRAVERTFVKDDIHYTVAFSISKNDVEKLRLQIIELIEKQRKSVRESGTETAVAFCCDFFTL